MLNRKIKLNPLDPASIKECQKQINNYKQEVIIKTELFARRLAEYGVGFAKFEISSYDAIDTGALVDSIGFKAGDVLINYHRGLFSYVIYTDCPYAGYVEFGTGIRGGLQGSHPLADALGWKYDVNNHADDGWYYFKNGAWHWTDGYVSRPFMLETYLDLSQMSIIQKVAREVFN